MATRKKTEFKVKQQIVYPSQGVGVITEIFEKEFNGEKTLYYKIYVEVSDMVVMVPVNNAKNLGIRAIVEAKEAKKALNLLGEDFEPITSDWKLRYQMNLDLLKKGTIADIAKIVRCLYYRSKIKELPIQERKLYDNARTLLIDEIAIALGKDPKDVEGMIHVKLEPPGAAPKIKRALIQDDDDDDEFNMDDNDSKGRDDDDDDDDDDDEDEEESLESRAEEEEDFDDEDDDFN
ncbi:MAG: CarD family transcriptional regulator [Treponema sp.]|nr:CarD family transcriptional regulator [Treponema sp.]MEE3435081.1 CarD family transcriptional regulator [Treponema sp.]